MVSKPMAAEALAETRGKTTASVIPTLQEGAGQQVLEHLSVHIDPRHRRIDRGCPQVKQTRSTGADQNDLSLDVVLGHLTGQHLPSRNILRLIVMAEFKKHPASTIGRHNDVADADVVEAGGLAERGLATGV